MAGKNKKTTGKGKKKIAKKKAVKPKVKARPKVKQKVKQKVVAKKKVLTQKKKVQKPSPVQKPVQQKRYRSPDELKALLSRQKQIEDDKEEAEIPSSPESERRAMMGRCVGRTFNHDEAKGICQQFEAAGYETALIEKKRGGLSLYEVWASKREEVLF